MATSFRLWELDHRCLRILTYPLEDVLIARRRLVELAQLGVYSLVFEGPVDLWGVRVVAKGTTSVVIRGFHILGEVAVKVRRLDANRPTLIYEARRLKLANSVNVGPRLIASSRNFLVWEFVEGEPLAEWILEASPESVKLAIRRLLGQAVRLDMIGLVHQELSRVKKHVLVTKEAEPVIFDFETASLESRRSNLTQLVQFLFIRESEVARRVREIFNVTRDEVLRAVRHYKRDRSLSPLRGLALL
ncbi:MAG: hypothetical protein DRJ43_02445 [Thermoprotei archaeon]|nr:MAG: hypothetical protein DRJ43_02445 [Thermoprotei archaeon]